MSPRRYPQLIDEWPVPTEDDLSSFQEERGGTGGQVFDWLGSQGWFRWVPLLTLVIGITITGRLMLLQIVRGQDFRSQVDHRSASVEILPAPRGAILDVNGQPLVINAPDFVLSITPADLPRSASEKQLVLQQVADLTTVELNEITSMVTNPQHRRTDPVSIVDHIDTSTALQWMVTAAKWPGVNVTAVPTRQYPLGAAASNVIGYIGKISQSELQQRPEASLIDLTGKTGIEKQYNDELTGTDGSREVKRNVFNQASGAVTTVDPTPGQTLHLSIDADLQQHLYDRLLTAIHQGRSTGGAAVAIDPRNGRVLALVTAPSYDDNWFVSAGHSEDIRKALTDSKKPLLNRAIAGQYPSGSIVKPLIGTAALAEHIVTPDTTVLSTGGLSVGGQSFPDWKSGGHGVTNISKAIAESVNTYFYEVGGGYEDQKGLGVDRIVKYLQLFGWGTPVGIDLPGEESGLLPTKEWRDTIRTTPWRLGDTYHLAIGQGDLEVTPLQVATSVAAIANGGTLFQPQLLTKVTSPDGKTLDTVQPHVIRTNIAPLQYIKDVQVGMRQGVLSGSSRAMQSVPVPVAGKTGTAQFGVGSHTHAWYTCFAPYDQPTIALAIVIEGGGEGNEIALPVAKDVLTWYFGQR